MRSREESPLPNRMSGVSGRISHPHQLAELLETSEPEILSRTVGDVGAHRVRHGRTTFCDLVIGARHMGIDPIELFRSGDVP